MSKPNKVEVPCWRYKRDERTGREGMLISHLCETEEEKERFEAAGYIDTIPPRPEIQIPEPEPEEEESDIGIDLDGDGQVDIALKAVKPKKKKPGRPAKKR